tara:strand:+ start:2201 stop:3394 length:1194 start_codon:yes stop_codon:yes gene_type:complete
MTDLTEFKQQTTEWLEANCPASMRKIQIRSEGVFGGKQFTFPSDDAKLWFDLMVDKGWTAPQWAKEYGGAGLSNDEAKILNKEMDRLGCRKPLIGHGLWMLGPALLEYGTEAQKLEHLPKIARGEIRWCQGYSEPGSGSDLASLRCKAEDLGDHYLLNGQKSWTSDGDKADWIFCLVRTNDEGIKQEGITFVLFDMDTPGITVRPVPLITGESHFCDTFLDNVKVPKDQVVGEIGKGWSVAKALLVHERTMMADIEKNMPKPKYSVDDYAKNYLASDDNGRLDDGLIRDRLAEHMMRDSAIKLTQKRAFEEGMAGDFDMRVATIFKYIGTEEKTQKDTLITDMMGMAGAGWDNENFSVDEQTKTHEWMSNKALTIAGGSSEVQLNVISKRALGLPEI